MNRNTVDLVLVTSVLLSGIAMAAEVPAKKSDPVDVPAAGAAASVPKANSTDAKAKSSKALKWDQLDPEAVERFAKKDQWKSPFSAVPAER